MKNVFEALGQIGVVPVITINRSEDAMPLAHALLAGGVECAEITFRTAAAAEAIRRMVGEVHEMLVGAGTVLTVQQAEQAVGAGAQYIVSPGFDAAVVDWCQEQNVPVLPGVATPTEINMALARGLKLFKFFRWGARAQGVLRALSRGAVHPHRRDQSKKSCTVPGIAKRRRLWRKLDGDEQHDLRRSVR